MTTDAETVRDPAARTADTIELSGKGFTFTNTAPFAGTMSSTFTDVLDGTILWYNRLHRGQQTRLSSRIIVHYRWNVVDEHTFSTSWLTSMLTKGVEFVIKGKVRKCEPFVKLKEKLDDALMKLAIKVIPRHVYVFPAMPLNFLKEAQS